jgi:hypothetical protein
MLVFSVLNGATNTSSFILPVYLYIPVHVHVHILHTYIPTCIHTYTHTVDAKTMKTFLVDIAYSVPLCFIPISISDFYLLYLCTCIPTIEPVFCWFTCYCILHCSRVVGMSSNSTTPCHHTPSHPLTFNLQPPTTPTSNRSNLQTLHSTCHFLPLARHTATLLPPRDCHLPFFTTTLPLPPATPGCHLPLAICHLKLEA